MKFCDIAGIVLCGLMRCGEMLVWQFLSQIRVLYDIYATNDFIFKRMMISEIGCLFSFLRFYVSSGEYG